MNEFYYYGKYYMPKFIGVDADGEMWGFDYEPTWEHGEHIGQDGDDFDLKCDLRGDEGCLFELQRTPEPFHFGRYVKIRSNVVDENVCGKTCYCGSGCECHDENPEVQEDVPDDVNEPSHYKQFGKEVIDIIRDTLTEDEFRGYCKGNELKYRLRAGFKGEDAAEDIAKAMKYREFRNA